MSNLVAKIVTFLLEEPLDAVCSASVVYLAMDNNTLGSYNDVKDLAECAVNSALGELNDSDSVRKERVSEILPQVSYMDQISTGYACNDETTAYFTESFRLKAMKVLKKAKEPAVDHAQEKIEQNLRALQSKLGSPQVSNSDTSLYNALKKNLNGVDSSGLTWQDPLASMVLSDDSTLVENLKPRQKRTFMEPCENMKCDIPASVNDKCEDFANNFNKNVIPDELRNITHNSLWVESEIELGKRVGHILGVIGEVLNNPAFATSMARNEQSEGTYVTDVIVPLLRATLGGLPNGSICLSTAERQSVASKTRRSLGANERRIGKKPDIMSLVGHVEKTFEIAYVECSRVVCTNSKKVDDRVKLWRETLDGVGFVAESCRPTSNQFGIVGIQVAGKDIYLNVLVKDASGIPRYFHLDHAEIPLTMDTLWRVKPLIRLLLRLRVRCIDFVFDMDS
nr:12493_t:CDS:2 [Entrophospora candida]